MYRLPWQVIFGLFVLAGMKSWAQSPHEAGLGIDCGFCHNEDSWHISTDTFRYDHSGHDFDLTGQHVSLDCKECHTDLKFNGTHGRCIDCHTDMHRQSVGADCARCHTTDNWLVDNIPELHEMAGFSLEGSHFNVSCEACHISDNGLLFNDAGNVCSNCHLEIYHNTTNPPHVEAGFSTDCNQCHDPMSTGGWTRVSHYFFPLTKGHDIMDCAACHRNQVYVGLSSECFSCHEAQYNDAEVPDHKSSGFPTDCTQCHTTDPGWSPAVFEDHDDLYFPVYSGKHGGEWKLCSECHTTPGDYTLFSCTDCHKHRDAAKLERKHDEVGGYSHDSRACLECHPSGR